jgi:putative ABC transport system permease protein
MSLRRHLARGLRVLFNRSAADRDLDDEARHYFDEAAAEYVSRGMSPAEARRAARLEWGSVTTVSERVRDYGWENMVSTFVGDLRYAARRLRGSPVFSVVTVLTLALGLGASTAIFSAVSPILFEPLPYPHPERVVAIWDAAADGTRIPVTFGTYRELEQRARAFEALAVARTWQPASTGPAEPARFDGQRVTAAYFRVLGVRPALGRDFEAADDRVGGPRVVILSDGLWRRRFGGDPSILERPITLNETSYSVVGVMPAGFENVPAAAAELWTPLQYDPSLPPDGREWGHHLIMVGRLRPGMPIDQARHELDAIARSRVPEFARPAWAALDQSLRLRSLQDDATASVRPALLAVLGAVLLLLAIACVNVTNLLLARGAERRAEFAMRIALGAGRARVIRQILTESAVLSVLAGVFGIAIAIAGVDALIALSPPDLPRAGAIGVDARVFAFALCATTLVGLLVGLMPALQASRGSLHGGVQQESRRATGAHQLTRRALVVAEVALALMLLIGSGLLLRSLNQLFAIEPGFNPASVLTMQVQTSGGRYVADAARRQFYTQALEAVRALPGVKSAGFTSQLPLSGDDEQYGVAFESNPTGNPENEGSALRYAVSPGYVETMAIPLRRGRLFDSGDATAAPAPVLINESFARRRFPGQDPIGRRIHFGSRERPWDVIVGVVGDVRQASLAAGPTDAVYIPATQWPWADPVMALVVRAHGDTAALAPAVRAAIWSVDKNQPIVRVATMDALLAASGGERRFALILFETFGLVALVLAATGIYGVLSGSVTERTREIGVRAALGASRRTILVMVLRQGITLTVIGIGIGLVAAVAASRALITLLFQVTRVDPITYAGVVALLLCVSAVACWFPAWRAVRVDPAVTLRAE